MSDVPANDPECLDASAAAVELVVEDRPRDLGTIVVARILPAARRRMVGPFIFFDHMGPVELPPGVGFDVRPHPHIGLSTVTYFLAGENVHRDSLGTVQTNRPHDLNLMTAGRGIVHSERAAPAFRASGGLMHGLQIWLALPGAHEDDPPSFEHHPAATLPASAGACCSAPCSAPPRRSATRARRCSSTSSSTRAPPRSCRPTPPTSAACS